MLGCLFLKQPGLAFSSGWRERRCADMAAQVGVDVGAEPWGVRFRPWSVARCVLKKARVNRYPERTPVTAQNDRGHMVGAKAREGERVGRVVCQEEFKRRI